MVASLERLLWISAASKLVQDNFFPKAGLPKTIPQHPDSRIAWPAGQAPHESIVFTRNVIDIAASPDTVWTLLVDCVPWPAWYKKCSDVSILRGGAHLGRSSKFRFKILGFYFEPEVVTCEPLRQLVWSAKGPAGTGGAHAWYIEPTLEGCRVVTEEAQQKWLMPLLKRRTEKNLLASHQEWLVSLKRLAES